MIGINDGVVRCVAQCDLLCSPYYSLLSNDNSVFGHPDAADVRNDRFAPEADFATKSVFDPKWTSGPPLLFECLISEFVLIRRGCWSVFIVIGRSWVAQFVLALADSLTFLKVSKKEQQGSF